MYMKIIIPCFIDQLIKNTSTKMNLMRYQSNNREHLFSLNRLLPVTKCNPNRGVLQVFHTISAVTKSIKMYLFCGEKKPRQGKVIVFYRTNNINVYRISNVCGNSVYRNETFILENVVHDSAQCEKISPFHRLVSRRSVNEQLKTIHLHLYKKISVCAPVKPKTSTVCLNISPQVAGSYSIFRY